MNQFRKRLPVVVGFLVLGAILLALGGREAVTQIRAALVRDVDTPALAPFRGSANYSLCCLNDQRLITTVPAGKRLVIDYISYFTSGPTTDQLVFAGLRSGQFGPLMTNFEIHPPHVSLVSTILIQDGAQPLTAYFEAGEEVWVSASHNTGGSRQFEIHLHGHYITP